MAYSSAQDLVNAGYYGYQGWGNNEALADFKSTGGVGKGGPSLSSTPSTNTSSVPAATTTPSGMDVVQAAQNLRNFNIQANQPAIGSLQSSIAPLEQRYADLISSIKGAGSVAVNTQTQATTGNLGARGLLPSSPEGQQELATSLLAPTQATAGALAQTGISQQSDINAINNAIAQLQTGNPDAALTNALGLAGIGQGAANILTQTKSAESIAQLENLYRVIPYLGGLYNTQSRSMVGGGGGGTVNFNTNQNAYGDFGNFISP